MDSVQAPPQQQDQAQPPSSPPLTFSPPTDKEAIRALSQTFGHIPGVEIFSDWEKRKECSDAAVHRSVIAGICGNKKCGAYSIAVSGGYVDDEDGGDVIIYTGAGGRKKWTDDFPPKRLRHGPQISDQSWDDMGNSALLISCCTGNPVRVIRSWKCPSKYAPLEGYRYDGLYTVASCWTAVGIKGFRICRCRLQRLPDQPPIPVRPPRITASRRRRKQRLCSPYARSTNVPNQTDTNVGLNQSNLAPAQNATGESPRPPQERAMSEILTLLELELVESPSPQHQVSTNPDALPAHDSRDTNNNINNAKEDGNEHRGDDVTLVPSEDGRADTPMNLSD